MGVTKCLRRMAQFAPAPSNLIKVTPNTAELIYHAFHPGVSPWNPATLPIFVSIYYEFIPRRARRCCRWRQTVSHETQLLNPDPFTYQNLNCSTRAGVDIAFPTGGPISSCIGVPRGCRLQKLRKSRTRGHLSPELRQGYCDDFGHPLC